MKGWAEARTAARKFERALAYSAGALLLLLMLGWSMNLFRVRGIRLAVHGTFLALLAVVAAYGWIEDGFAGLLLQTGALLTVFVCVVLHELGHCFAAMHYGIGVRRILLLPIGGMAEFDSMPREPRREVVIALAGPAVNFALVALLWAVVPAEAPGDPDAITWAEAGRLLLQWNLIMGLFNLLPAFPMDGGRILRAAFALRLDYTRATFWAATTAKILCVTGLIAAAWYRPIWMALPIFIFVLGELEYRAVKRREIEDEHWRSTSARFGLVGEPPLLVAHEGKG